MGLFTREVVGLSVEESRLSMAQVRLERRPRLTAGAFTAKDANSNLDELLPVLRKSPVGGSFRKRETYVAVDEQKLFRKIIEIPRTLTEDEVGPAIQQGVAEFLPGDIALMELDYQVIPDSFFAKPSQENRAYSVVSVEREIVQAIVHASNTAHLQVMAIDSSATALARSLIAPLTAKPAMIVYAHSGRGVVILAQQGLVWATALIRWTDDASVNAATAGDELAHLVKFYSNRTGFSESPEMILLAGDADSEKFKKALASEVDVPIKETKFVVASQGDNSQELAIATGAALYPLYEILAV